MFMDTFVPKLFNMSLTASVAIVLILLLRLLLKRAPKVISYALWGVVLFRLLCPVSIGSRLSLFNLFDAPVKESGTMTVVVEYVPGNIVYAESPTVTLPVPGIRDGIGETLPQGREQLVVDPQEASMSFAAYAWMTGVFGMAIYSIVSYGKLRRKLAVVVPFRDNIFIADDMKSPFVIGLFKPKIYLPPNLGDKEQAYIILHEQHHIKRLDHVVKALAFLALAIHWFNPLVWAAFILASKDMEMSCDEAVIRKIGGDARADYSASLLSLATGRRVIAGTPLAFGEGDTKGRIYNLSKWKKPAVWVVVIAAVVSAAFAVCLMTNPQKEEPDTLPLLHTHSYGVVEVTYETSGTSFSMVAQQNTPVYAITETMQLMSKGEHSPGDEWTTLGILAETELSKENFDDLFFSKGNWFGKETASDIRGDTANAWSLIYNQEVLYYVLQQKNGEVYLAYGYYDYSEKDDPGSDDTNIRWLFKLAYDLNEDTGIVATSGDNVIPVIVFPAGTPLSDMKDSIQWLDIAPGPDDTVPFTVLCDGKEQYGWYSIYDAETMESLDFMRPSGLSPQTYLFQNAEYGQDYIVTLRSEAGDLLCFGARIGAVAEPVPVVTKWFDYLESPDKMYGDGRLEISLPEFPDVTFRWYPEKMEAVTEEEIIPLYTGMPIWNAYFCDLTGDGLPELCSTISWGSGMIDNRVIIYDYANGVSYSLEDRGAFDYMLRYGEDDGRLYVDKRSYFGGGVITSGRLVFQDDCIRILGQPVASDAVLEIIDPTNDPDFSYDTAIEKIYDDENNEYFISGVYSQYIIVRYVDGTQEDVKAALYSGRATLADLDKFGIRYWAEPKVDPFDAAISAAILEHYRSDKPDGLIHVESHILLANEEMRGIPLFGADDRAEKVTAYLLVYHVKYSTYGGTLEAMGGSYVPAAITFSIRNSGEYVLEEYWEPRDGSFYAEDIRHKFPGSAADDAQNAQAYIEELKAQTYNKALAYMNNYVSLDVRIAELLDIIQSSPAQSSNPGDYIRAHEKEYDELLGYGEFTLRYCFSEFLRGDQIDLRGHIMALACEEIMLLWGEAYTIDSVPFTGQDRFDAFRKNAESLADQFSPEDLEKSFPGAFLLLQMSSDRG